MQTIERHVAAVHSRRVCTEADWQALPADGRVHELIEGELVRRPKEDAIHHHICLRLSAALLAFAETRRLGAVWDFTTGFHMDNCNVRVPDISFVTRARLRQPGCKRSLRRLFPGPPDLAVEILSRHHTRQEIDLRLKDYFRSGSRLAWIVDAEAQQLEACHSLTERRWVGSGGFLEGEVLLPGFRYRMADLFKDWDWE
jgi:Uma2 family endonuclease